MGMFGTLASEGRGHTHLKDLIHGVRFIDGENEHTLNKKNGIDHQATILTKKPPPEPTTLKHDI